MSQFSKEQIKFQVWVFGVDTNISEEDLIPFLSPRFDTPTFIAAKLQSGQISDTVQKLTNGLNAIDKELNSQVLFLSINKKRSKNTMKIYYSKSAPSNNWN